MLQWRIGPARHRAAAQEKLPGPDYYEVLGWIHAIVRPAHYLEIGVANGKSFRKAKSTTHCIAVDPRPGPEARAPLANVTLFRMTSDEYFREHAAPDLRIDLAFLDGLHQFGQTLRDLEHLEPFLGKHSVVMVHDCLPLDARTASSRRRTLFWSGDIWKMVPYLHIHRPDLSVGIVRTPPTGLGIVTGFSSRRRETPEAPEIVSQMERLDFEYWNTFQSTFQGYIANTRDAVSEYLAARGISLTV
jgi:hypothetical protein